MALLEWPKWRFKEDDESLQEFGNTVSKEEAIEITRQITEAQKMRNSDDQITEIIENYLHDSRLKWDRIFEIREKEKL
jgi:hypothetical protein